MSKVIPQGNILKKIYLRDEDFIYGRKNRPSTPIKSVINFSYGNVAAQKMRRSYSQILIDRSKIEKIVPRITRHYEKLLEHNKILKNENENEKQLFKIKKYLNINSKVKENLRNFKTFYQHDNLDKLISKVEREINDLDIADY